jgi:hypothetical protein
MLRPEPGENLALCRGEQLVGAAKILENEVRPAETFNVETVDVEPGEKLVFGASNKSSS